MKNSHDIPDAKSEPRVRYNLIEINAPGIVLSVTVIAIMVAIVLPVTKWLLHHFEDQAQQQERAQAAVGVSSVIANSRTNFPQPREQLNAPADLAAFSARQQAELNSYGWVDRQAGTVRIPISHAMELFVQRNASNTNNPIGNSLLNLQQQRATQSNSSNEGGQP